MDNKYKINTTIQSHNIDVINISQSRRRKYPFIHKIVHQLQCEKIHQQAFETIKDPEKSFERTDYSRRKLVVRNIFKKSLISQQDNH